MTTSPIVANKVSTKVKEVGLPGNSCLPDNKRQTGAHLLLSLSLSLSSYSLFFLTEMQKQCLAMKVTCSRHQSTDSSWSCCSSSGRHPSEHVTCEKNKPLFLGLLIPNHPWKEFGILWTWEGERLYHFYNSQTWDEAFPSIINMDNRPQQYQYQLQTLSLEITDVLI